jgi:hypothetical protein
MGRLISGLVLGCLFGMAAGPSARAADGEKEDVVGKKRAALWQALQNALPEKYKEIDAYAENPSLSAVLFRSQRTTLTFSLKTGKVEEVPHGKALGKINRITFEQRKDGGDFALWYNGRRELTIAGER